VSISSAYRSVCNFVDFVRLPNGAVPEVLDEYLSRVAVSGVTMYVFAVFAYIINYVRCRVSRSVFF